jgi:hypothetical protein
MIGETSHRNGNAVIIFVEPLNVIGRVAILLRIRKLIDHLEQAIEANRIAIKRREIKCAHGISSFEATCG